MQTIAPQPQATPIPNEVTTIKNFTDLPLLLIIEDNADLVAYLQTFLRQQYRILVAPNGVDGTELAIKEIPDIIISDVMMPQKDGFAVVQELKAHPLTNHIPIVMLTAKTAQEDRLAGLSKGADAYLKKPFQKEELLIRLSQLTALRAILEEKYQTTEAALPKRYFLNQMNEHLTTHLADEDFDVFQLSRAMHLSRSQIHRKLKALTDLSTSQYIKQFRLRAGRKLLLQTDLTISEVAYHIGYKYANHFSADFKELFDVTPSAVRK
ncbi:MAG: response regulator [Bacteroidota bacterium]